LPRNTKTNDRNIIIAVSGTDQSGASTQRLANESQHNIQHFNSTNTVIVTRGYGVLQNPVY